MVESSQSRVTRTVESLRVIRFLARVNVESREISRFFYIFCFEMAPSNLENDDQHAMKWRSSSEKILPIVVLTCLIAGYIYLSCFRLHFTCLFHSQSFQKSQAQPSCKCCSLSVSIVLNVRFTTNGMCMMNPCGANKQNKMITTWDLHCCLVQQLEALRTCCSAFPITTKWCIDQDVKVLPGATFTKRTFFNVTRVESE